MFNKKLNNNKKNKWSIKIIPIKSIKKMNSISENLIDLLHFLALNLIIFGFVGNVLCYKVFSSTRLQNYPVSVYMRAISIFDSVMLINAIVYFMDQKFKLNLSLLSDFFCKFKFYFSYCNGPISPWIIVVVSLDRYLSIAFPKRFTLFMKSRFQISIMGAIFIYNYVLYSFMTWNSVLESEDLGI